VVAAALAQLAWLQQQRWLVMVVLVWLRQLLVRQLHTVVAVAAFYTQFRAVQALLAVQVVAVVAVFHQAARQPIEQKKAAQPILAVAAVAVKTRQTVATAAAAW
jgi:hypothetical protein